MPTLNEQLSALRAEKEAKRNPAWTALMNRATEELAASGILDRIAKVGDRAPLFARPDLDGRTVRLRSVLRSGPVIVSFFRGRW
jgi:hypothetical protein